MNTPARDAILRCRGVDASIGEGTATPRRSGGLDHADRQGDHVPQARTGGGPAGERPREAYELPFESLFEWCRRTIGADTLDTVTLHDGRLMLIDDDGFAKGLPVNEAATALYASRCRPDSAPVIVGDVVIVEE